MRLIRHGTVCALLLLHALAVQAGNGTIDFANDTVNFTMNLRFPATAAQLTTLQNRITDMSHLMWDATEGQLRVGTVTFTCGEATLDVADYWVFANPIRSNSSVGTHLGVAGVDTGTLGVHINMAFNRDGQVFFHEFGHLAFNLSDEYPEGVTACGGKGPCFDGATDEQNHCIMQQNGSFSEFCVTANHDPLRGNNSPCIFNPPNASGAPDCSDDSLCSHWNTTTLRFESSRQQMRHGEACWQTLVDEFPQLTAPGALPAAPEPGGWVAPTFVQNCNATSTFVLVLDDSGSMAWSVKSDTGEVCGNGIDDDGDGGVDEADDCADSRMNFVKAAGRALLELAEDPNVKAGVVRFDSTASPAASIQTISGNLTTLRNAVDALDPGTQTAIGSGLNEAKTLIDADPAAASAKAAFVVTDGHNNAGPSPDSAAAAYTAAGIRIYALATGQASNSDVITAITENSMGEAQNEQAGDELVTAIAELFASWSGGGVVVPQTPYALTRGGNPDKQAQLTPRVGLFRSSARDLPDENFITFPVEPGARRLAALLGGNMADMSGFGVDAVLQAPDGTIINTAAPPAGVKVVFDRYFTLVRLPNPIAGLWRLTVRGRGGAAPTQTGTLAVLLDNPQMHMFADVDRAMVTAPGQNVTLTVESNYVTQLRNVALAVNLRAPDGSITAVPIAATDIDAPQTYRATLSSLPMQGRYELLIDMRTTAETTNDPGENLPGEPPLPPNSVPIPQIQRSLTRTFFVDFGPWVCPPGRDCDGDGIIDEPTTGDNNGNGIPPAYDPDDNGDNIPDGPRPGGGSDDAGTNNPFGDPSGRRRWWFGGAVGSSHPLGRLDRISDANIYAKLDALRPLNASVNLRLALGLAQFTAQPLLPIDHPRYLHLSPNVQFHAPLGVASRWFVNGGPGFYRDEGGSTSAGANVGAGVMIPVSSNVLELGADYHRVNDDRGSFVTWHLGILFH